ncbi:basal-body rod modification protein FlgD [Betaproteobacteria bacterium]|nr:basal-body rod modification protein FlgD [Betaproteobacteria bacterium]
MNTNTVDNTKSSSIFTANSSGSATGNAATSEEIQNRFLTLLVAQLENQDPLNPLENTEITNQLAQMSTVNGIEKLSSQLSSLVDSLADTQAVQASALINKTVMVPGPHLTLAEGHAYGGVSLAAPADAVTIHIYDASGSLVQTQSLDPAEAGNMLFSWDGETRSGTTAPDGSYTFKVTASNTGGTGSSVTSQALQLGMVSALTRTANGNFVLDLGPLGQYNFADVQQVF